MIQLILEGIALPENKKSKYRCYPSELSQKVDMISGRRVHEIRGNVQMIEWSYGYLELDFGSKVLAVLRSGKPINVAYLPDDSTELVSGEFWVESIKAPKFAFSVDGVPFWHDLSFTLREVKPHD